MYYAQRKFPRSFYPFKLAAIAVLAVFLCVPFGSVNCLKLVATDTYLLSPHLDAGRSTQSRTLPVLFDSDSMFGALNWLCNISPALLASPDVSGKVLKEFMSDFYWNRILALVVVQEYLELRDGVAVEKKISRLMLEIDSMDISPIVRKEMRHLLFLVSGVDHQDVSNKAYRIIFEEAERVLDYVNNKLDDREQDVLSLFLARREYAGSRILDRLGSELFKGLPYPAAQWKDFEIEHKAFSDTASFPVMKPEYNGHTRNLPSALNWQIVSDMLNARKLLDHARGRRDRTFSAMLDVLGDSGIFGNLIEHYQTLLDDFLKKNPTRKEIDYFLTALSTVLAYHPSNSVEKGRVGAIMVAPATGGKRLRIIGVGFDGAPSEMHSDRDILGRELWVDRYVPRRDEDRDKPDFRFLFLLRRSPCAEKKALMQAVSFMEQGKINPDDIDGATMYTSRTPCYQCVMALSQFGVGSVSAGDYQFRDEPSRKVDEGCGFNHSHPEMSASGIMVDSLLTYDLDSVAELSRWARILNVLRGFSEPETRRGLLGKRYYPEREFLDVWDFDVVRRMIADYKGAVNVKELFNSSHYRNMLERNRYTLFLNALYDYTYKIRKEIDDRAISRTGEHIRTAA